MTIRELYDLKGFQYKMSLLAGRAGMDNEVTKLYYLEDLSICDWTRNGELLITTGMMIRQDPEWLLKFVKNVSSFHPCAIMVNVGGYIKDVPMNIVEYCDEIGLPLFSFPWEIVLQDIIAELTNFIYEDDQRNHNVKEALLSAIFQPERKEEYENCFRKCGFTIHSTFQVVLITIPGNFIARKTMMRDMHLMFPNSVFFVHSSQMVVVLVDKDIPSGQVSIQGLIREWEEQYPQKLHAGMGDVVTECNQLSESFRHAETCLSVAKAMQLALSCFDELSLMELLMTCDQSILRIYSQRKLAPLLRYDAQNGTEYLKTLEQFIVNKCNIHQVAETMFIHKNTASYRMRKICELTNEDIYASDVLLEYTVAFLGQALCSETQKDMS